MVFWKGFELLTDALEGRCSIQLSYQNKYKNYYTIVLY